jgi:hypothetical protein
VAQPLEKTATQKVSLLLHRKEYFDYPSTGRKVHQSEREEREALEAYDKKLAMGVGLLREANLDDPTDVSEPGAHGASLLWRCLMMRRLFLGSCARFSMPGRWSRARC